MVPVVGGGAAGHCRQYGDLQKKKYVLSQTGYRLVFTNVLRSLFAAGLFAADTKGGGREGDNAILHPFHRNI